jgi:hypothetical protein
LFWAALLPLDTGPALRAAVQPGGGVAGGGGTHDISVFAANVMLPVSFTLKRVLIARSAANAGAAAASSTSIDPMPATACQSRRSTLGLARRVTAITKNLHAGHRQSITSS